MNKKLFAVLFSLIVIIGAVLRLAKISELPPALNWDEVSHGYNAYSIMLSGKDEWGASYPITNFRAYGDYPLPLNLYITIPFIKILGLNEFSIRLPHAILGVLTIISAFFLAFGITKKRSVALVISLLVAIGPWYIFPSRFVVQSNVSVFFLIAGAAAFFNRHKNKYLLPLSFLLFGFTLFSYHSTRIFTPLFLFTILIIYKKEFLKKIKKDKRLFISTTIILLFIIVSVPFILAKPEARVRSAEVFLINEGAVNKIINQRQNSNFSPLLTKVIYNRPTYFFIEFAKNYIGYFSPTFLFLKGGTQYQFSLQDRGLLYLINLPFFYIGLLYLFSKALRKEKRYQLLLFWLILAPIPASISTEKFAVIRSTTMLPLPELITTLGLFTVLNRLNKKVFKVKVSQIVLVVYILGLWFSTESYFANYLTEYPINYSWTWQYGYKQAVEYVKSNYTKYDKIIVTKKYGEPHEFFLFYWPWEPEEYRNDANLNRFYQSNWYWVDSFDKFYFVNDWQIIGDEPEVFVLESGGEVDCREINCLLITSPGNVPIGWNKVKTINFLNGEPAFEIHEN